MAQPLTRDRGDFAVSSIVPLLDCPEHCPIGRQLLEHPRSSDLSLTLRSPH